MISRCVNILVVMCCFTPAVRRQIVQYVGWYFSHLVYLPTRELAFDISRMVDSPRGVRRGRVKNRKTQSRRSGQQTTEEGSASSSDEEKRSSAASLSEQQQTGSGGGDGGGEREATSSSSLSSSSSSSSCSSDASTAMVGHKRRTVGTDMTADGGRRLDVFGVRYLRKKFSERGLHQYRGMQRAAVLHHHRAFPWNPPFPHAAVGYRSPWTKILSNFECSTKMNRYWLRKDVMSLSKYMHAIAACDAIVRGVDDKQRAALNVFDSSVRYMWLDLSVLLVLSSLPVRFFVNVQRGVLGAMGSSIDPTIRAEYQAESLLQLDVPQSWYSDLCVKTSSNSSNGGTCGRVEPTVVPSRGLKPCSAAEEGAIDDTQAAPPGDASGVVQESGGGGSGSGVAVDDGDGPHVAPPSLEGSMNATRDTTASESGQNSSGASRDRPRLISVTGQVQSSDDQANNTSSLMAYLQTMRRLPQDVHWVHIARPERPSRRERAMGYHGMSLVHCNRCRKGFVGDGGEGARMCASCTVREDVQHLRTLFFPPFPHLVRGMIFVNRVVRHALMRVPNALDLMGMCSSLARGCIGYSIMVSVTLLAWGLCNSATIRGVVDGSGNIVSGAVDMSVMYGYGRDFDNIVTVANYVCETVKSLRKRAERAKAKELKELTTAFEYISKRCERTARKWQEQEAHKRQQEGGQHHQPQRDTKE